MMIENNLAHEKYKIYMDNLKLAKDYEIRNSKDFCDNYGNILNECLKYYSDGNLSSFLANLMEYDLQELKYFIDNYTKKGEYDHIVKYIIQELNKRDIKILKK